MCPRKRINPRGTFSPEVVERLREVGAWTREFGETIYGTRGGPMKPQSWGVMTSKEEVLYLHVLDPDAPERLELPGTAGLALTDARVLGSGTELFFETAPEVAVHLPASARRAVDTIVVLHLR